MIPDVAEICHWTRDGSEFEYMGWQTDCGNCHVINDGTPNDNQMNFCTYCGRKLVQVIPPEVEDDD